MSAHFVRHLELYSFHSDSLILVLDMDRTGSGPGMITNGVQRESISGLSGSELLGNWFFTKKKNKGHLLVCWHP